MKQLYTCDAQEKSKQFVLDYFIYRTEVSYRLVFLESCFRVGQPFSLSFHFDIFASILIGHSSKQTPAAVAF